MCVFFSMSVSIHAPAGGATCEGLHYYGEEEFQFTRPQGARLPYSYM